MISSEDEARLAILKIFIEQALTPLNDAINSLDVVHIFLRNVWGSGRHNETVTYFRVRSVRVPCDIQTTQAQEEHSLVSVELAGEDGVVC